MSQAALKESLTKTIENLKANPAAANVVFRADTKLEENVRCSAKIRDFPPMIIDEPPELGGKDSSYSPVEIVLVALGSCQEIMYSAYASVMDIELKKVEVDVKGYLDLHGLFGMGDNVPPGFKNIKFETRLESDASEAEIASLVETVENHCPVLDILITKQDVTGSVSLNGKSLAS